MIKCGVCGKMFPKGGKARRTKYCSEECADAKKRERNEQYKEAGFYNNSTSWLKLRYKILARDGFACQYCGLTPKDGARLEVDHIHPISQGGTNDEFNLITACSLCNLGKGDALLEQRLIEKLQITKGKSC